MSSLKSPRDLIADKADVLDVISAESAGGDLAYADALIEMLADHGYYISRVGYETIEQAEQSSLDKHCRMLKANGMETAADWLYEAARK